MNKFLDQHVLMQRWRQVAGGLLSDADSPTAKDLKIVGLLSYLMDIESRQLLQFLMGMRVYKRSRKQIKQWLDFREQIILEEELPEDIRIRHRLVNDNYVRIVNDLDSLKEQQ